MTDDDQLKDLLDSAAPDRPDLAPAARTAAVTRRARAVRRRNGLVLAAAVVAVVGVGVAVPVLTSGDDSPSTGVAGDPAPTEVPTEVPTVECPAEPLDVGEGVGADDLPGGASSARLCPATDGTQQGRTEFTLPTEPVTDGVDELLDTIRALPAEPLPDECAAIMVAPMPWTLVVGYPDGSTRTLGTTMTTCATVDVAGKAVLVDGVLAAAEAAATPATATAAPPICPQPQRREITAAPDTYAADLADLDVTAAIVCYGVDPLGSPEYAATEGTLNGAALDTVVADVVANTTARQQLAGRCIDTGPTRLVVLAGADGQVTLTDDACSGEFRYAGGYWLASAESENALAVALGGRVGR